MKVWVVDFETNNSDKAIETGQTHVWLWDLCEMESFKHQTGRTIKGFFEFLEKLPSCTIYSHNLKFDGSFILDYLLLKANFKWVNDTPKALKNNELCTLIDAKKVYYQIAVKINNRTYKFRDSCKKIPGTVRSIAESWKLPILKGEIDYRANREEDYIATDEEIAYIRNDTEIIARVMKELYAEGMISMTASSDSYQAYIKSIGESTYNAFFPELKIELDDYIRKSYNGGVCFVNDKFKERELENVKCYDVNSMYPSIMVSKLLPYGKPIFMEGKYQENEVYPLYIQHVFVYFKLKKGFFPSIMKKGFRIFTKNEYIEDTDGVMLEMWLTSVDMELLFKHYDVLDIEYVDYLMFKGSTNLFKGYIFPLYDIKCHEKGAKKQLAKLKLNSLYGKFATNPHRTIIEPYEENGKVEYRVLDAYIDKTIYTAISTFVTAYARQKLFNAIEENHDIFVYCDTDSIHTIGEAKGLEVDKSKIGAWDLEKEYRYFKVLAQKTYYGELEDGTTIIKACGCPEDSKKLLNKDNFNFGTSVSGKLRPVHVKGGVVLVETNFTLQKR